MIKKEKLIEALGGLISDKPLLVVKRLRVRGVKVPIGITNEKLVELIIDRFEQKDDVFSEAIAKDLVMGGYLKIPDSKFDYQNGEGAEKFAKVFGSLGSVFSGIGSTFGGFFSKIGSGKERERQRETEENALLLAMVNWKIAKGKEAGMGKKAIIWMIVVVFVIIAIIIGIIIYKKVK